MKLESITARQLLVAAGIVGLIGLMTYQLISPWFGNQAVSDINTIYGRRGSRARTSVNGTSVFAKMFAQQGSRTTTWAQVSPRLRLSDVIVWTPNSFELPSAEEIEYFENEWLSIDDGRFRTLIYVARDYDAAITYWQTHAAEHGGARFLESRNKLARAQSEHAYARSLTGVSLDCEWFSIESTHGFFEVAPSDGPWAADLDPEGVNVLVSGIMKLSPADEDHERTSEVLLESRETPLIACVTDDYNWPNGQVIVLLNGSSVLNLPLVNHENRKIAAQLIDLCGNPNRTTFLESSAAGLPISNQDANGYSGFEALTEWPMNAILLHLIVAGILFCIMVFPIFGRPRELAEDTPSDFGKHIRAMGDLLSMSHDRDTAIAKIRQYRNLNLEPTATETIPKEPDSGNPFKVSPS